MTFGFEDNVDRLPAELAADPYWADARNSILASLRKDALGLPMTTAQNLIMERMATFYAITRKREADPEAKLSANDIRANNQQWLAMTAEFNKQITIGEDKRMHAMFEQITKIINNALMMVDDEEVRKGIRKNLTAGFKEAGY